LDACIAAAQERNADAIAYNRSLSNRIAEIEQKAAVAIANNDSSEIRSLRAEVAKLKSETKTQIQGIDKEISIQNKVIQTESGTSGVSSLRSQVSSLENTKARSERELSRLASLDNRLDA
jgi:polyhydroxyalkanoate synthesis regulator phasin